MKNKIFKVLCMFSIFIIFSCKNEQYIFETRNDSYRSVLSIEKCSTLEVEGWEKVPMINGEEGVYIEGISKLDNWDVLKVTIQEAQVYKPSLRERLANRRHEDEILFPIEDLETNELSSYEMVIQLSDQGVEALFQLSSYSINESVALIVDHKVLFYARIMEPLTGGIIKVSGNYSLQEWLNIAIAITGEDLQEWIPLKF